MVCAMLYMCCSMCLLQYVVLDMFYMLLNVLNMLYVPVVVCGDRCTLYVARCALYDVVRYA